MHLFRFFTKNGMLLQNRSVILHENFGSNRKTLYFNYNHAGNVANANFLILSEPINHAWG